MVQVPTGVSGAYSSSNSTDKYSVQPWFPNALEQLKRYTGSSSNDYVAN